MVTLSPLLRFSLLIGLLLGLIISQLPYWFDVNRYHAQVEALLSAYLQTPVRLRTMQLAWQRLEPVLHLQDVSIADPQQQQPHSVHSARITVRLDWLQSWQQQRVVIHRVILHDLSVVIDPAGLAPLQPYPAPRLNWTEVMAWLLALPTFEVQLTELQIKDAEDQVWVYSQRAELHVTPHAQGHRINVQLRTMYPPMAAKLVARVTGQPDQPATWHAQLTFNGQILSLSDLWRALQHSSFIEPNHRVSLAWLDTLFPTLPARMDISLNGVWRLDGLERITGTAQLGPPMTVSKPPLWTLDLTAHRTSSGVQWQSRMRSPLFTWQQRTLSAHSPDQVLVTFSGQWPPSPIHFQVSDVAVERVVQALRPYLPPDPQQRLTALAPRGQVAATGYFDVETAHYRLDLSIKDGYFEAVEELPRITHLTAQIGVEPQRIQITDAHALMDADRLFPAPIPLSQLNGEFTWNAKAPHATLQIPHLAMVVSGLPIAVQGEVRFSDDKKIPYSDMRIRAQNVAVSHVINTLPTEIMDPHLVRWLQDALHTGQVTDGYAVLRGHLTDFPFDNGRGLFEARVGLRDVTLDYAPPWPALTQMDADLLFRNNGLQVTSRRGRLFNTKLQQLTANIADFDRGPLIVQGQLRGDAKTFLQFIREGPLAEQLNEFVSEVDAHGEQALDLQMTLPLSCAAEDIAVQGAVHFQGGTVRVLPLSLDLTDVRGPLTFTERTVQARDVAVRVFGAPAKLSIAQRFDVQTIGIDFTLRGRFDPWRFIGGPPPWWTALSDGESHWNVTFRHEKARDDTGPSRMAVDFVSDLQGLALHLPAPLYKNASEKRDIQILAWPVSTPVTRLPPSWRPDARWQVAMDYGRALQAQLEINSTPDHAGTVHRGELRIQAGTARLPPEPGLHVIAHLDQVDTKGWEPLLAVIFPNAQAATAGSANSHPAAPPLLRRIEAQLRQVHLGDQRFSNVTVIMRHQPLHWVADISGSTIQGRVIAPAQPTATQPITVDLSRLALHRAHDASAIPHKTAARDGPVGDPRGWQALDLTVQHLYLNDHHLGPVQARIRPDANGMQVQITMQTADDHLAATLQWQHRGRTSQTDWEARLHSRHPAALLERLGYSLGIQNDAATLAAKLSWPGSPFAPSTADIEGTLDLVMEPGRLLEVEPGMSGRMVGLLNLSALTRRLQLDFSDLSRPGMAFDRISGHFRWHQDALHTDDFALIAPSAQIHFNGRIGLSARDYDMTMKVTLPLSAPLGIAGAIAGGPVVGAAIWAFGEMFRPSINQITQMHYAVTGSWDDPQVLPIQTATTGAMNDSNR